jgi:hypothetical protein
LGVPGKTHGPGEFLPAGRNLQFVDHAYEIRFQNSWISIVLAYGCPMHCAFQDLSQKISRFVEVGMGQQMHLQWHQQPQLTVGANALPGFGVAFDCDWDGIVIHKGLILWPPAKM